MLSLAACEATGLFQLVEDQDWDDAILQVEAFPEEAKLWIVGKSNKSKYRRLPIHEAIIRKAPFNVIQCLLSAYPEAAGEPDDGGRLPIHHAAFYGAPVEALKALVMLYPESLNDVDKKGVKPLDLFMEGYGGFTDETLDFFSKGSKFYATLASEQQQADRDQKELLSAESNGKNINASEPNNAQSINVTTEKVDQTTWIGTPMQKWLDEDFVTEDSTLVRAYIQPFEETTFLQEKCFISKEPIVNGMTGLFQLIEDQDWEDAMLQAQVYPEESKVWVGSKSSKANAKRLRLPLHEATLRRAPYEVIECLIAVNPGAAKEVDESGSLPIHHAANHCSDIEALVRLARIFPGSLEVLNKRGLTPLDLFVANASKAQLKSVLLTNNPFQVALSTNREAAEVHKPTIDQMSTLAGSEGSKMSQDTTREVASNNEIEPSKIAGNAEDIVQEDFVMDVNDETCVDSQRNHSETIQLDVVSIKDFLSEEVQEKNAYRSDAELGDVELNAVADGSLRHDAKVEDVLSAWEKETLHEGLLSKFSDDDHEYILADESMEEDSVKVFENALVEEYFKDHSSVIKGDADVTEPIGIPNSVDFDENFSNSAVATMIENILRDKKFQGDLLKKMPEAKEQPTVNEDSCTMTAAGNVKSSDFEVKTSTKVRSHDKDTVANEKDTGGELAKTGDAEGKEEINTKLLVDQKESTELTIIDRLMQEIKQMPAKGLINPMQDPIHKDTLENGAEQSDAKMLEKLSDVAGFKNPESRNQLDYCADVEHVEDNSDVRVLFANEGKDKCDIKGKGIGAKRIDFEGVEQLIAYDVQGSFESIEQVEIPKDCFFEPKSEVEEESNDLKGTQEQEVNDVEEVDRHIKLDYEVDLEATINIDQVDEEKIEYLELEGNPNENTVVKWIKGLLHTNKSAGDSVATGKEMTEACESASIPTKSLMGINGNTNDEDTAMGEKLDCDDELLRCESKVKEFEDRPSNTTDHISTEAALLNLSKEANEVSIAEVKTKAKDSSMDFSVNLMVETKFDDEDMDEEASENAVDVECLAVEIEYVEACSEVNAIERSFQEEALGSFINKAAITNGEYETTAKKNTICAEEKNEIGPEDQLSTVTKLLTLAEVIHSANFDSMDDLLKCETHVAYVDNHKEEAIDQRQREDDREVESLTLLREALKATVKELQTALKFIQEDTENKVRKLNGHIYDGRENFSPSEDFDDVTYVRKDDEELKIQREELKSTLDKLEEELGNLQRAAQEKSFCLDSKLNRVDKDLSDKQSLLECTNAGKVQAGSKNATLRQEIDDLSTENDDLLRLVAMSKEAEKNLATELENAKCTEASLTRELEEGKSDMRISEKNLKEAKAEVNLLKKELSDIHSLLACTTSEREQAEHKYILLGKKVESLSARNESLLHLIAVSKEAEKNLAIDLEHANISGASTSREVAKGKSELKRTQKLLEEARTEVNELKKCLSETHSLLECTASAKRQLERKNSLLCAEIDSMSSKNEDLLQLIAVSKEAEKILAIDLEHAKCTETTLIRELEQEKSALTKTQKLLEEAKEEVNEMSKRINLLSSSISLIMANASDYRAYTKTAIDQLFSSLGEIDQEKKIDFSHNHDSPFDKTQAV